MPEPPRRPSSRARRRLRPGRENARADAGAAEGAAAGGADDPGQADGRGRADAARRHSADAPVTESQGAGAGGGAGTGTGTGVGSGQGSGLGPGFGGGIGGGAYRPGSGITLPRVLREVKPAYTADAMRAKVQGSVWLECIVMPDGSVGDVKVTRSLDPIFGLDQEAIKAAQDVALPPGHAAGRAGPGHHHDRADLHAALVTAVRPSRPQAACYDARMTRIISSRAVPRLLASSRSGASRAFPAPVEGDFIARDFAFTSGERLPEVKIHYRTVGHAAQGRRRRRPQRRADPARHGRHGRAVSSAPATAGRLFGKGQPLDAEKYFIILPDNVGHGAVEQAERRPAHEVSAVSLHRHGEAAVRAGHRRASASPISSS